MPEKRSVYRKATQASSFAKKRAVELRRDMTPPERRLWRYLRGSKLDGLRFRRQHPIGPYIADFYCHEAALVIEIDGATHDRARYEHDVAREGWLGERGIRVIRYTAIDIRDSLDGVLAGIRRVAGERLRAR